MSPRPNFTHEQLAAIEARTGSSLLAANAGSGKTAVMVERIAAAIQVDGVPVNAILALTFTEKAAGELAERLRRRLTELGEADSARAVDGAWIGTIHGFCARLLRSQPLAAGLDPRFEVMEETAAERLANAAYDDALEVWGRIHGAAAIDLAASYGPNLRDLIRGTYSTLRARGHARPRVQIPPRTTAPDASALAAAGEVALRELARAGDGVRVAAGRTALAECARLARLEDVPWPGELNVAELKGGARALQSDACEAYREVWAEYRGACAEYHAHTALTLIDSLLDRYGRTFEQAKLERAAVDFEDLELRARDLLEDAPTRERWAERFRLIMIDEFQDTNAVQLEILEHLERDNLFAVGDEFQSIYRFRHADVGIFRRRAQGVVRRLNVNFRSKEELLDVLNTAFAPEFGERFAPLRAGRKEPAPMDDDGALRLFSLDPPTDPPVELLITDTNGWDELEPRLGLAGGGDQPWRRAEARAIAHRLRTEVEGGRRAGDIVVLVRATSSLRLLEEALEEQGLPTYVVGGRGYWSQEQVRDGLAWLRVLANPHDEEALLTVLSSPFCDADSDALVLLAEDGRARGSMWAALQRGEGAWAAVPGGARLAELARLIASEREHAERAPLEVLLERAIVATGYDLATLARPGGDRRLANLRKLMRLAGEYERAEGRDLRGFLADAQQRDLAEAREGEAALESEGLDAIRLMTIHRAKGLEFPVVAVVDLGRQSGGRRPQLLVGADHTAGLRLAPLGGGDTIPTQAWEQLAAQDAEADAEEERRLFYVAMTRARELLILSGGTDTAKWPAPRNGGPPIDWIVRALTPTLQLPDILERTWEGRPARLKTRTITPETLPPEALESRPRTQQHAQPTALPSVPAKVTPTFQRGRPAPQRLSYSQLSDYAKCGYRFYLKRVLNLPSVEPPPPLDQPHEELPAGIDPLTRGSLVHAALEDLDFDDPKAPSEEAVRALARDIELSDEEVGEIQDFVHAFARSPLCQRLTNATRVTREAGFHFAMDPDGSGPLVRGFVDVLAIEPDGTHLVVDYKTDHVPEEDTPQDYIARNYETQRLVYALAALRAGAQRVEVAYCLLERPDEPLTTTFTAQDAPDVVARINELARGILTHEYPVTPFPHRELCGTCPGRTKLCSYTPDLTLRPPPAPWPGAPVRRTPPAGTSPVAAPQPR
ncbi:UvrD-helicase domain-containing protein [Solirubrobacter sp. CPCC 204708]|uniref:DNA 3'-5' helicase n=1 Tax=Solirubrobacter deserti TaxID=2282478 RepID=A0ABT4RTF1_9ACTN|nr:UvrD-helicase domain-containing protein [Solirubrobacter deserti]MBE2318459.1 UvrD-helicase domain-containing protein [Solirubrobacter deserti]MDA0141767.1 UvrD-helicase domain-containing protein [Solirubrobacter deserti]